MVAEPLEFDWDRHNEGHLAIHGISRSDAENVLSGNHILLAFQMQGNEQRWIAVGATRAGRILSIVFTIRSDAANYRLGSGQGDGGFVRQGVGSRMKANVAKAKVKQLAIPKFSNEAQEAEWWDAHRSEVESEIRQRVKQKRPLTLGTLLQGAKTSQPITLRISREDLDTARRLAAQKGLGYQTYIKMLLREALAKNAAK